MEFLNILLGNNKVCFLCFKESNCNESIYLNLEFDNTFFKSTTNLKNIIKYLFPSFDIVFARACQECTDLILKLFVLFKRNEYQKYILENLISSVQKDIDEKEKLKSEENYFIDVDLKSNLNVKKKFTNGPILRVCDNKELNEIHLNKDQETVSQNEENIKDNQCSICYREFVDIKLYNKHLKTHERKRKKVYYSCNHCNYRSLCKTSLEGHINKIHLKSRQFVCQICYKGFYHKKNLIEHQKTHTQVRNEICEVCGEQFLHKKSLLDHLKLHTGEKPYGCYVCGKRFVNSGRRSDHMKRSHTEKRQCCVLCDKKFSLPKELNRHIKTVHS